MANERWHVVITTSVEETVELAMKWRYRMERLLSDINRLYTMAIGRRRLSPSRYHIDKYINAITRHEERRAGDIN